MYKLITLLLTLGTFTAMASPGDTATTAARQSAKPVSVTKADKLFENQRYAAALEAYHKAWQATPTNPNLNFKLGLCWHYLLQYVFL